MSKEVEILSIRIQLERLISRREMMKAANVARADQGYAQAYGEDAFFQNEEDLTDLLKELEKGRPE